MERQRICRRTDPLKVVDERADGRRRRRGSGVPRPGVSATTSAVHVCAHVLAALRASRRCSPPARSVRGRGTSRLLRLEAVRRSASQIRGVRSRRPAVRRARSVVQGHDRVVDRSVSSICEARSRTSIVVGVEPVVDEVAGELVAAPPVDRLRRRIERRDRDAARVQLLEDRAHERRPGAAGARPADRSRRCRCPSSGPPVRRTTGPSGSSVIPPIVLSPRRAIRKFSTGHLRRPGLAVF